MSGRQSRATLLTEADFSLAAFLLPALGEGSFLNLLEFLDTQAPDPLTRQVTRLPAGTKPAMSPLGWPTYNIRAGSTRTLLGKLRSAVERRYDNLVDTSGLNQDVFDSW